LHSVAAQTHLSSASQVACSGEKFRVIGKSCSLNVFSEQIRLKLVRETAPDSPERRFGCPRGRKAAITGYLRGAVASGGRSHQVARRDRRRGDPQRASKGLKPAQGPSCALLRRPRAIPRARSENVDGH